MAPLSGLRVLDFSTAMPGPFCATLLADLGAEVVKVERPGGDPARALPALFASVNRSRRSLVLNLKTEAAREVAARLARRSDVVLEQFRPGVAARLGIDYATLRQANPALIYCSISGFGQEGPYRAWAGHDINYVAMAGLLGLAAGDGPPVPAPVLIADAAAGLYAAVAVLAALEQRRRTGEGAFIDLSMTDCVAALLGPEISRAGQPAREPARPNVTFLPHYGVFPTADGGYLSVGVVYEDHFWQALCRVTGLDDLAHLDAGQRARRYEEIRRRLAEVFRTRSRREWEAALQAVDVPAAAVATLDEVLENPQFAHRGLFTEVRDGQGQAWVQVGPPMKFSTGPARPPGPPPTPGQHTREILEELGYTAEQVEDLLQAGAAAAAP